MTSISLADELSLADEPGLARALRVTLVAMLASALAISATTLFLRWHRTPQLALLVAAVCLVAVWLSHSGRMRPALLLVLLGSTYAVMHAAARASGIENIGLAILPVLIVVSGLLLDRLTTVFFTATAILATCSMLAIRYFVLREERYSTNDMGDLFIFTLTCAIAAIVGRLFGQRIEEDFRHVRESESRYRRIFENVQDVYYEMSGDGTLLELSPASAAMFGVPREEMIGCPLAPFCVNTSEFDALLAALHIHGRVSNRELVIRDSGEVLRYVLVSASLQKAKTGEERLIGSIHDISERRRLEEDLRRRAEELQKIMDVAPVALFVAHDPDCNEVTGNRMANGMSEAGERTNISLSAPGGLDEPRRFFRDGIEIPVQELPLQTAARGVEVRDSELEMVLPSGARRLIWGHASPLRDAAGRVRGAVAALQDVTAARQHTNDRLRESDERFRNAADAAPVIIWFGDTEKRLTFVNEQMTRFTGLPAEQLLGHGWSQVIHPDDRESVRAIYYAAVDRRGSYQLEYRARRADGEYRHMLGTTSPRYIGREYAGQIGSVIDITDLKRRQEEDLIRQKLETVGTLANGIAHDFNNLLGAVLAQAELALAELASGSYPEDELKQIREVAIRGSEIVRQLMIYAGNESEVLELVDLSYIVDEMLALLAVSVSKHARLETDLGKDLPAVRANPAQLRQVVMNLVTNASKAIGERAGVIRVATACLTLDPIAAISWRLTGGNYLLLEVSDTGCGMPRGTQAKVFDPFFANKSAGHGLGLAVVDGIVRGLHGAIRLTSEPGQGITFEVLLPCAGTRAEMIQDQGLCSEEPAVHSQTVTVLVAEDEEPLRQAVVKMLSRTGFSVIETGDGLEALKTIREYQKPIDILFLDLNLPGTPSREILEEAKRLRPGIRPIITSAYSEDAAAASLQVRVEHFLRKPYRLRELVNLVRKTLS